jgi:hypothetical protein
VWYTVNVTSLHVTNESRSSIAWCFKLTAQKNLFWMHDGDDNEGEEEVGEERIIDEKR